MPYQDHHLLTFGGYLGSVDTEIWTCGIRLRTEGDNDLVHDDYLEDTAEPALAAWFSSAAASISQSARLMWAKCNEIGPDGHYKDPTNVHERFFGPVQGASGGDIHPFQVSCCYTWHTNAVERGPGSRGRIYVPMVTGALNPATGTFTDNARNGFVTAARDLINSLDASLGIAPAGVVRPCISTDRLEGANNEINGVSVDNKFDIQRRRANSQPSVRQYLPVEY